MKRHGVALVLILLIACSGDDSGSAKPPIGTAGKGNALRANLERLGVQNKFTVSGKPGLIALATIDSVKALEPVVLEDAKPMPMSSDQLELLTVRVTRTNMHAPGSFCTDDWPPKGFGPTVGVHGLRLAAGQSVGLIVWVRARRSGDGTFNGLILTYRQGKHRFQQEVKSTKVEMLIRDTDAELDPGARCNPSAPDPYTGDEPFSPPADVSTSPTTESFSFPKEP